MDLEEAKKKRKIAPKMTIKSPLWNFLGPAEINSEVMRGGDKPPAPERDRLPFDALDARRFELLSYLLISRDPDFASATVLLGKSTGDQGRDVAVYIDGRLHTIVQCKKFAAAFDKSRLIHELLKIALHSMEDISVLNGVNYEIWASGGLNGPASSMIAKWPQEWTEAGIRSNFDKIVKEYTSFSELTWANCKAYLLDQFPALIKPRSVDGAMLACKVNGNPALFEQFFRANFVVPLEDVAKLLGIHEFSALLELLKTFPSEQRLNLGTIFFGLTPFHFQLMTKPEHEAFLQASGEAIRVCSKVIVESVHRHLRQEIARVFDGRFKHPASKYVTTRTMTDRVNMAAMRMTVAGQWDATLMAFAEFPLRPHLEQLCKATWKECAASIVKYDPSVHAADSDEAKRATIANCLGHQARDEVQFCAEVMADIDAELAEAERLDRDIISLIPHQILMIGNSSPLEPRFFSQIVRDAERVQPYVDARREDPS